MHQVPDEQEARDVHRQEGDRGEERTGRERHGDACRGEQQPRGEGRRADECEPGDEEGERGPRGPRGGPGGARDGGCGIRLGRSRSHAAGDSLLC